MQTLRVLLYSKAAWLLRFVCVVVVAIMYKPYCTDDGLISTCVPCPENSLCNFRKIVSCDSGFVLRENLCVRDELVQTEALSMAKKVQSMIEYNTYQYECLGNLNVSKKYSQEELFYRIATSWDGSSELVNEIFDEMLDLVSKQPDFFNLALDLEKRMYSFRFNSLGSCIFNKYHVWHTSQNAEQGNSKNKHHRHEKPKTPQEDLSLSKISAEIERMKAEKSRMESEKQKLMTNSKQQQDEIATLHKKLKDLENLEKKMQEKMNELNVLQQKLAEVERRASAKPDDGGKEYF